MRGVSHGFDGTARVATLLHTVRSRSPWSVGLLVSSLVHASLVLLGLLKVQRDRARAAALSGAHAPSAYTEVELDDLVRVPSPSAVASSPAQQRDAGASITTSTARAELGGAHSAQNIDAERRGERGDGLSREPGRLLADRAAGVNLSPLTMNTLRADQEHRLRTASVRESPQHRRATPNAGYDPWIASSHGVLLFRLAPSRELPEVGAAMRAGPATPAGSFSDATRAERRADETIDPSGELQINRAQRAETAGALERPAAGIARGLAGHRPRVAGPAAFGRASIEQGHASTTAPVEAERPRDTIDAEALATTLMRNALAASVQSGPREGDGRGGVGGGGDPGSGGDRGAGGRARPYGEGDGWISLDAPDARYLRYFQQVRRSLDPLWEHAFPRDEMLQLRQGTVIVRFTIAADGRVRGVHVTRRSGVDRFDQNVATAIAGAQLPPIPPALQRSELRISAPFVFHNPIVR